MRYIWITILLILVELIQAQSHITITFRDSVTQEAIPNLYVEDMKHKVGDFTQLNGKIKMKSYGYPMSLLVTHISYGQVYLEITNFKDQVIMLRPIAIDITEVVVSDVRRDLESALTKVIKARRQDKTEWKHQYAFYLETSYQEKQFEKIKAVFDARYNAKDGLVENQMIDGEFWFNPDSLFVNLDLDEWLGAFAPFASKDKDDRHFILTNTNALKKSNHKITLLECNQCREGSELFQIEGNRHKVLMMANLETKKVEQYHLFWKPGKNGHLTNLISGDTTKIDLLEMQYYFNDSDLEKMYFKVKLNDRLQRELTVSGFFKKVDYTKERTLYYLGSYRPKSLYERIIMDPAPDKYRLDTLFNREQFEGYAINKTEGLWSNNEAIRNYFYNTGTFNKELLLWNPKHENNHRMAIIYPKTSGFDLSITGGSIAPDITWIYSYNKVDDKWRSLPTIWSKRQSRVFNCSDTTYLTLALGMTFDLYELARQEYSPKDIKDIRDYHIKQSYLINKEMNAVLNDKASAIYLYRMHKILYDKWKIDHLTPAMVREMPAIIKYSKYQPLINKFAEAAHQFNGKDDAEFYLDMSRTVVQFYEKLLELSIGKLDYKKKGSIFSIMADQYYLLGNDDMTCAYFKSALLEWPDANRAYPKSHLMKLCGIK